MASSKSFFNKNANTPRSVGGKNKWSGMHQVWRIKFHLPKARYAIGMEFVHKCTSYSFLKCLLSQISCYKRCVIWFWAVSSVGRASRLHRGGQRFESFTAHQNNKSGGVAQLVRAIACHAIGRGFESLHSRHFSLLINIYIIKNVT